MKISYLLVFASIFVLGALSSCDWLEKADDVSFDTTVPVIYVVNETSNNPSGKAFTSTKVLDVASDPDIAKYASKIKEFKVNKVTYTISGANPTSVTFSNGKIVTSSGKTIASASSVDLSNTTETLLTTDNAGINDLAASLLSTNQAEVILQGNLSKTPSAFTLTVRYYLTITANALD